MAHSNIVVIICDNDVFSTDYAFLAGSGVQVFHFTGFDRFFKMKKLYLVNTVIVDINLDNPQKAELLFKLKEKNPFMNIILTRDIQGAGFPERIPDIFFCIKKPFSSEKLLQVIERSYNTFAAKDKRKYPRYFIKMPVELYCRTSFFIGRTNNISKGGMQVIYEGECEKLLLAIREYKQILSCRVFLEETTDIEGKHIDIPVIMKYVFSKSNHYTKVCMGFEFGDMKVPVKHKISDLLSL